MPYLIDDGTDHIMRSSIGGKGYITMAWPRALSLWELKHALQVVTFQLNIFIEDEQKKEDAETEYASWFPDPLAELGPARTLPEGER